MSGQSIEVHETDIDGLLFIDVPVYGDARGWFKENWQREKMVAAGLPDFGPVQHNVSYNADAGITRGMHAEPWDKLVSLAAGKIFGAWVDLRPGPGFGTVVTRELGIDAAVFVPRGVANGFQALEDGTTYSYLVNRHWSKNALDSYTYLNVLDETIDVNWPQPPAQLSDADRKHPRLSDVQPMTERQTVIVGATGQVAHALRVQLPEAMVLGRPDLDLTDQTSLEQVDWSQVGLIINAAAYTAVDAAETEQGRRECWDVNVTGLARLVEQARRFGIPMVHISSDYVFDGTAEVHFEDEPPSPLGVYGQTKAAGEALVSTLAKHWIVRTSWVVGAGDNFVRTMARLADTGACPSVVDDQWGRLTFAPDLAAAIIHLVTSAAPGIYNVSNAGPTLSWAEIAREIFELRGRSPGDVAATTTAAFSAGKLTAPRPSHSTLDLTRLASTGFFPVDAQYRLAGYLRELPASNR